MFQKKFFYLMFFLSFLSSYNFPCYAETLPQNIRETKQLAEQGNATAQFNMGYFYDKQKEYKKAFKWYQKAAMQGDATSQYNIGVMYNNGYGIQQDYEKAYYWYMKAAEQNMALAQFNLTSLYANGLGVKQDYELAKEWYGKSCKNGYQTGCDFYQNFTKKVIQNTLGIF